MKVKITERALVSRINRKLSKKDEALKICSERSRGFGTLGRYYVINTYQNLIVDCGNVDIVELAKDLGCIAAYEELETA